MQVQQVAERMPVVIASRAGLGVTLQSTYGYPGSEVDLLSRGVIPAGHLSAAKAAVLLRLLLATGRDVDYRASFDLANGPSGFVELPVLRSHRGD
jgi:L-asparaginase/Glu-tRNA(Gln) amidotransferase subunit D